MIRSARLMLTLSLGMPSSAAVPPLRTICRPMSIAAPLPDISSSTSTPSPLGASLDFVDQSRCARVKRLVGAQPLCELEFGRIDVDRIDTDDAPAARATGIAIRPIEPTPVITTLLPLTPAAITVCTALPSGSKTAANSSGIAGSSFHTLYSGIAMNSANAPSQSTPMILTFSQIWAWPVRQSTQVRSAIWPSAETRSPTFTARTASPTASTVPMNSWPITRGGLESAPAPS